MAVFTGVIPTLVAGDITALVTKFNDVRDALKALNDPWTSYSPSWTASANPAIGNGTITGRYAQIGKLVHVRIFLQAGSSTTQGTGGQSISLPVAAHGTGQQLLRLDIYTGTAAFVGSGAILAGASTAQIYVPTSSTNSTLVLSGSTTPNVGTSGNLVIVGIYEAA